jgi:hypothetical protein
METETIQKIADIMHAAGAEIIPEYAAYLLVQAAGFAILGVAVIAKALSFRPETANLDDAEAVIAHTLKWAAVFVGALFVIGNIPDLVSPKAAAIHQIIRDVRG